MNYDPYDYEIEEGFIPPDGGQALHELLVTDRSTDGGTSGDIAEICVIDEDIQRLRSLTLFTELKPERELREQAREAERPDPASLNACKGLMSTAGQLALSGEGKIFLVMFDTKQPVRLDDGTWEDRYVGACLVTGQPVSAKMPTFQGTLEEMIVRGSLKPQ